MFIGPLFNIFYKLSKLTITRKLDFFQILGIFNRIYKFPYVFEVVF